MDEPMPQSPEVQIEWVYSPLQPDQVRWYYYKAQYTGQKSIAAHPEIPHRNSLLRFCNSDNAALEAQYRAEAEGVDRAWWQEEAELATQGSGRSSPSKQREEDPIPDAKLAWQAFMTADERSSGEAVGVLVRSGAHEVDLRRRLMRPCYFPANQHRVLRGAWFAEKGGEWVPLKESLSDQLEEGHRQALWLPSKGRLEQQPGGLIAARLDLSTRVDRNLYALFASEGEAFLCQDTSFGWLRRLGSGTVGTSRLRLRRGYEVPPTKAALEKEADLRAEEADDYCAATPVTRLVLVVHGIGQLLSGANIAHDAVAFRSVLRQVATEQLPEEASEGRTEVLPVQWRKHLTLEIDQLAPYLMPPGVRALRQVLFATVVEILLYLTPLHRADILDSLVTSLNAQYTKFMLRNPNFKGPVSILAHSLGTILCYDVLCNQPPWAYALSPLAAAPPLAAPLMGGAMGEGWAAAGGGIGGGGTSDQMAALQAEVARLRVENQWLALQLDVARADSARFPQSPSGAGSFLLPAALPASWQPQYPPAPLMQPPQPQWQWGPQSPPAQQGQGQGVGSSGSSSGLGGGGVGCSSGGVTPSGSAVVVAPLKFQVDQFINIGSPLSIFLALRGVNHSKGRGLGTAASAPLSQTAPGQPCSPDGLPAVRRMYNLYHPTDPVGHRLEPLGMSYNELPPRPAYAAYYRGGKRIHIQVQEFQEDVSSAASKFGSTLLSSLAISRFRAGSKSSKGDGLAGLGEGELCNQALLSEEDSDHLPTGNASLSEAFGGNSSSGDLAFGELSLPAGPVPGGGGAPPAPAPTRSRMSSISGPAPPSPSPGNGAGGGGGGGGLGPGSGLPGQQAEQGEAQALPPSTLSRLTDGEMEPGGRTAKGRLDFVLQESSLENQYVSALSAHFCYWASPDVALFMLRAVHGLDVVTGAPKQAQQAQQQQGAEAQAQGPRAEGPGALAGPTSPRVHLASLPG